MEIPVQEYKVSSLQEGTRKLLYGPELTKIINENEVGLATNNQLTDIFAKIHKIDKDITDNSLMNPRFLRPSQFNKFEKLIENRNYAKAVNYLQTFSGQIGQNILHDLLYPPKDE